MHPMKLFLDGAFSCITSRSWCPRFHQSCVEQSSGFLGLGGRHPTSSRARYEYIDEKTLVMAWIRFALSPPQLFVWNKGGGGIAIPRKWAASLQSHSQRPGTAICPDHTTGEEPLLFPSSRLALASFLFVVENKWTGRQARLFSFLSVSPSGLSRSGSPVQGPPPCLCRVPPNGVKARNKNPSSTTHMVIWRRGHSHTKGARRSVQLAPS